MSININLVSNERQSTPRIERVKKLKYISFSMLFLIAISSLLLFIVNLRLSLGLIKNQQSAVMQDFSVYDKTSSKIFLRNSRLNDVSSVLNSRKKFNITAEEILNQVPGGVTVSEFKMDDTGIVMTLNSPTLLTLNEFLNNFLTLTGDGKISDITLDSLSASGDGFTMNVKAKAI